jgi:hypothetical protein
VAPTHVARLLAERGPDAAERRISDDITRLCPACQRDALIVIIDNALKYLNNVLHDHPCCAVDGSDESAGRMTEETRREAGLRVVRVSRVELRVARIRISSPLAAAGSLKRRSCCCPQPGPAQPLVLPDHGTQQQMNHQAKNLVVDQGHLNNGPLFVPVKKPNGEGNNPQISHFLVVVSDDTRPTQKESSNRVELLLRQ